MKVKNSATTSTKTSIYLRDTVKNKIHLLIPTGKQTEFINDALQEILEKIEKEKNKQEFLALIKSIKPVKSKTTARQTLEKLRRERNKKLLSNPKPTKTK